MFATVTNPIGNYNVEPEGITFNIDVFENDGISYATFLEAFYAGSVPSETLKFFNPQTTSITEQNKIDVLKNILILNSGGRTTLPVLPRKVINNGSSRTEYNIFGYITDVISTVSGKDYDMWSVDSQLSLSKTMSRYNYFYDLTVNVNPLLTTNSLTKTELEKVVNGAIYAKSIETGSTYPTPVTGTTYPVLLNIGVTFSATIGGTNPLPAKTQFLYKILVTDFPYSTAQ